MSRGGSPSHFCAITVEAVALNLILWLTMVAVLLDKDSLLRGSERTTLLTLEALKCVVFFVACPALL
jgi:hypothetical protein